MTRSRPIDTKRLATWLLLKHELGGTQARLFPLLFSYQPFYTIQVTD